MQRQLQLRSKLQNWLYGIQQSRGEPARWAWWCVAMLGAVLPEVMHRTLGAEELEPPKD